MSSCASGVVPGCSGAYTVKLRARSSRNESQASPHGPWRKTSAGPAPADSTRMRTPPSQTAIVCSRSMPIALPRLPGRTGPRGRAVAPPVVDPAIVVPLVSELGQHIAGKEVDILQCQLVWHRADLKQHHQIPNAQFLDDLFPKAITYGRRASCDHVAPLHKVAITKRLHIIDAADGICETRHQTAIVLIARWREQVERQVQAFLIEVLDMPGILRLGLRIGVSDGDELQESRPVRVRFASLVRDHLPVALHHRVRCFRA